MLNEYPLMTNFLGSWYNQDYDINGPRVEDSVRPFCEVSDAVAFKHEVTRLLKISEQSLDLQALFPNLDVSLDSFAGGGRGFLLEVLSAISSNNPQPQP